MNVKKLFPALSLLLLVLFIGCNKDEVDQPIQENAISSEIVSKYHKHLSTVAIVYEGMYLSNEDGKKDMTMYRDKILAWEKFKLFRVGLHRIKLQGANGKFVRLVKGESNSVRLRCDANIKKAYNFTLGTTGFLMLTNFDLRGDRRVITERSKKTIGYFGAGIKNLSDPKQYYAFKNAKGKYLSSENCKRSMTVNRSWVRAWEKFELIKAKGYRRYFIKSNNGFVTVKGKKLQCGKSRKNAKIFYFGDGIPSELGGLTLDKLF